ncbi:hypothetical protein [Mumia sp. DW29H23]|uniref:hypothetical protein n=1 Tax=Mumia sp. DW29H23 TaxID=3421241 RepID=UPI003D682966
MSVTAASREPRQWRAGLENVRETMTVRALVLSGIFLVAFFALYALFVHTADGQRVDIGTFGAVTEVNARWSDYGTFFRDQLPLAAAALAAVLVAVAWEQRRLRVATIAVSFFMVTALASWGLKVVVLGRPDLGDYGYEWNTFPAGQTTIITTLGIAILILLPLGLPRAGVVVAAFVLAIVTAGSAVITFAHRPSDVVGSFLLVGAFAVPAAAASGVKVVGRWPLWIGGLGILSLAAGVFALTERWQQEPTAGTPTTDLLNAGTVGPLLSAVGVLLLVYTAIAAVTPRKQPT